MNLTIFKLEKGLIFFLLFSPAILVLLPGQTKGEAGNSVGESEEDSQESEDLYGAKLQAQYQDGFIKIMEKLQTYEEFMRKMEGVPEKLDEIYAFLPLLRQLHTERLERLERERLEREREERERVEKLAELYAFLPQLQELKKMGLERSEAERLERERQEQQRREQQRLEQQRLEKERLKAEMIKFPRAKLYTGTDFRGNFEIYYFNSASGGKSGCHFLQSYPYKIKSIDTDGTCVRLFHWSYCIGWSQAFYPGIDGNALHSKLNGVECIGPCSPNELEDAEIKGSGSELTVKKGENGVPDLIADYFLWRNKTDLPSSHTSIRGYNVGVGNRLEGVWAEIHPKDLRSPEEAEQVRNAGRSFSSGRFELDEDREEVGFAIPLELGGVSNQLYNIFPQDKAAGVKYREAFVPLIKQHLQEFPGSSVTLSLRFLYETWGRTKPKGIWYYCSKFSPMSCYLFN